MASWTIVYLHTQSSSSPIPEIASLIKALGHVTISHRPYAADVLLGNSEYVVQRIHESMSRMTSTAPFLIWARG